MKIAGVGRKHNRHLLAVANGCDKVWLGISDLMRFDMKIFAREVANCYGIIIGRGPKLIIKLKSAIHHFFVSRHYNERKSFLLFVS